MQSRHEILPLPYKRALHFFYSCKPYQLLYRASLIRLSLGIICGLYREWVYRTQS